MYLEQTEKLTIQRFNSNPITITLQLFLLFFTFSCTFHYNEIAGKYYYFKLPKSKDIFQSNIVLYLNENKTFTYLESNDIAPYAVYKGVWLLKKGYLLLNKVNFEKDTSYIDKTKLEKVEKFYSDSLEKISTRLLYFYEISQDTTFLTGAFLSTTNEKYVVGMEKPISISNKDEFIEFSDLDQKIIYEIDTNERSNIYKFYLKYSFKDNYIKLDSIPFNKLKHKNNKLYYNQDYYFIKDFPPPH